MIHECIRPMPCTTPLGDGWIWYIKNNGMFENDEVAVVLNKSGEVKHFTTEHIKLWHNETYNIQKQSPF